MSTQQIFDPAPLIDAGMPSPQAHAEARRRRDERLTALRGRGLRCMGWLLANQTRPGPSGDLRRTVFYITID